MEIRFAHYSPNGHDVTIREFGWTATAMKLDRWMSDSATQVEISMLTDAELTSTFKVTSEPRKMTKIQRSAFEGIQLALSRELTRRGFNPDEVRWG